MFCIVPFRLVFQVNVDNFVPWKKKQKKDRLEMRSIQEDSSPQKQTAVTFVLRAVSHGNFVSNMGHVCVRSCTGVFYGFSFPVIESQAQYHLLRNGWGKVRVRLTDSICTQPQCWEMGASKHKSKRIWWLRSATPGPRRQRKQDCKSESNLGYIWGPVSRAKQPQKHNCVITGHTRLWWVLTVKITHPTTSYDQAEILANAFPSRCSASTGPISWHRCGNQSRDRV